MTDYELEYRRADNVCGEPQELFVQFFREAQPGLRVLDLGCGQGRDALAAARQGHRVHGVDLAATGIQQMLAAADAEHLKVTGEVADLATYSICGTFDAVILDRVLHMLPQDEDRRAVLQQLPHVLPAGGHVLVSDIKKHQPLIQRCLGAPGWCTQLERGLTSIYRRQRA